MKLKTKILGLAALPLLAGAIFAGDAFADISTPESRAAAAGFNDVEFYKCVEDYAIEKGFAIDDGVALTDAELASITERDGDGLVCLDVNSDDPTSIVVVRDIVDITGAEKLTGIKSIMIGGDVADYTPLKSLPNLRGLIIDRPSSTDVLDLSGFSAIESLALCDMDYAVSLSTLFSEIKYDPGVPMPINEVILDGMDNLKTLALVYTGVKKMDISGLDLEYLQVYDESLTALDIASQKNLKELSLSLPAFNEKSVDISSLKNLEGLTFYVGNSAETILEAGKAPAEKDGDKYIYDLSGFKYIKTIPESDGFSFDEETKKLTAPSEASEGIFIVIDKTASITFSGDDSLIKPATLHITPDFDVPNVPDTGLFTSLESFIRESYARYIIITLGFLGASVLAVKMLRSHALRKLWK